MADLKKATNSVSQEDTTDPKFQLATEGLYRHPETGAELAAFYDPVFGNAQAQGLTRVGFVRVGDVPQDYDKTVVVNHDFAGEQAKGQKVTTEDRAAEIVAAVKLLQDEKNAAEDQAAKANDKSSENIPEVATEQVQADGAAKVDAAANQESAGVNTPVNAVKDDDSNKKKGSK